MPRSLNNPTPTPKSYAETYLPLQGPARNLAELRILISLEKQLFLGKTPLDSGPNCKEKCGYENIYYTLKSGHNETTRRTQDREKPELLSLIFKDLLSDLVSLRNEYLHADFLDGFEKNIKDIIHMSRNPCQQDMQIAKKDPIDVDPAAEISLSEEKKKTFEKVFQTCMEEVSALGLKTDVSYSSTQQHALNVIASEFHTAYSTFYKEYVIENSGRNARRLAGKTLALEMALGYINHPWTGEKHGYGECGRVHELLG